MKLIILSSSCSILFFKVLKVFLSTEVLFMLSWKIIFSRWLGGNKVKLILLENVWIYKNILKVSHVNSILKAIIMDHDSSKKTSVLPCLISSYTTQTPHPTPKMPFYNLSSHAAFATLAILLTPTLTSPSSCKDGAEKGRYLRSVHVHNTEVKLVSKKWCLFSKRKWSGKKTVNYPVKCPIT